MKQQIAFQNHDRLLGGASSALEAPASPNNHSDLKAGQPQLELTFSGAGRPRFAARRQRRLSRAGWWFQRMRAVVDCARDWSPVPQPRPEQIWFREAWTEPTLAPRLEQSQICE